MPIELFIKSSLEVSFHFAILDVFICYVYFLIVVNLCYFFWNFYCDFSFLVLV